MSELFLNDSWTLYFHDPNNEDWDVKSYHNISTISSVADVANVCTTFNDLWTKGMFFLMREHIQPVWEDPCNANGGCFSIKVMKQDVPGAWRLLMSMATGETLLKAEHRSGRWDSVCGISISPKRNYCILRVWISSKDMNNQQLFNFAHPAYTSIMFKEHTTQESC